MTKFRHIITLSLFFLFTLKSHCQKSKIDTSIVNMESTIIDGIKYKAIYRTDDYFYIINSSNTVIFKSKDYYRFFEFKDFDNDGKKDILFSYIGNIPTKDLLLFDTKSKNFKPVENFSKYPEPLRIEGTKYFYSYHRSGCADSNWDSDLFFIENFKTFKLGTISGRECKNSDEKNGIYIYISKENKEILTESIDINEIYKFKNNKWDFIKEYWAKNYKKFE